MILNTTSCIYAQNSVQNTSSLIYIYAETKISGIENIHIQPATAIKNLDFHLVANTTTIFNLDQVYVADNTIIYFNASATAISSNSNAFDTKKSSKKAKIGISNTPKTKTTTSFKTVPPFSNSPIGFFKGGFNVLVLAQSFQNGKTIKGLIHPKTTNYTPLLVEYYSPCGAKVPQDAEKCNIHYCKYTFSLPPPVFC